MATLLLLCLLSLTMVSVTNACDGHHHHHHKAPADHDHQDHKRQRRLRKGGGSNDHHQHHHDATAAAADCDEDHPDANATDATTQGTLESQESRELFSVSSTSFMQIDGVNWATAQDFLDGGGRCTTREPAPEEVTESDALVTAFRKRYGTGSNRRRRLKTIVVPLYFHVLVGDNNKGALTDRQITDQINVLKDAFAPDFTFELKEVTVTTNDRWHTAPVGSTAEREFKTKLRKGEGDALNFYTLAPSDGVLGWATLPSSYARGNPGDGVCVNFGSLPGGRINNYNEGMFVLMCYCYYMVVFLLLFGSVSLDDSRLSHARFIHPFFFQ